MSPKMKVYTLLALQLCLCAVLASCKKKDNQKSATNSTANVRQQQAPAFSLPDQDGNMRSLAEFRGQKVALYFYPKSGTPGCTRQACSLRDGFAELREMGITVLGITYDSLATLRGFKKRKQLPFVLLSDVNKEVAKAYGAYGGLLSFLVPRRVTYLIDEQGMLVGSIKDVDVDQHAQQIIDAFAQ